MDDPKHAGLCKCPHHLIIPIAIFVIGTAFMLLRTGTLSMGIVAYIWPAMLMLIGIVMLGKRHCACCAHP